MASSRRARADPVGADLVLMARAGVVPVARTARVVLAGRWG